MFTGVTAPVLDIDAREYKVSLIAEVCVVFVGPQYK